MSSTRPLTCSEFSAHFLLHSHMGPTFYQGASRKSWRKMSGAADSDICILTDFLRSSEFVWKQLNTGASLVGGEEEAPTEAPLQLIVLLSPCHPSVRIVHSAPCTLPILSVYNPPSPITPVTFPPSFPLFLSPHHIQCLFISSPLLPSLFQSSPPQLHFCFYAVFQLFTLRYMFRIIEIERRAVK